MIQSSQFPANSSFSRARYDEIMEKAGRCVLQILAEDGYGVVTIKLDRDKAQVGMETGIRFIADKCH